MTAPPTPDDPSRRDYMHLDVFTSRRFEGNQLAVFLDARGLEATDMQILAREMNFSESTFLLPAERPGTDVRMRIFTPGVELPMAGHPTIGTTFALAQTGVIAAGRPDFTYELGVGPTRVELTWNADALVFASMDQLLPDERDPVASAEQITRAVGVDVTAHSKTGLPIKEISCGVPYILLPVASRADVDAAVADVNGLKQIRSAFGTQHTGVYLFSTEPASDDVTAYSRMFASGLGIPEDPATGSACGPLGCYWVRWITRSAPAAQGAPAQHGRDTQVSRMVSWQGVAMGRPSRIHIAITQDETGAITRVQVGGEAVVVARGTLHSAR